LKQNCATTLCLPPLPRVASIAADINSAQSTKTPSLSGAVKDLHAFGTVKRDYNNSYKATNRVPNCQRRRTDQACHNHTKVIMLETVSLFDSVILLFELVLAINVRLQKYMGAASV
jgi:hypothetical protein